MSDPAAPQAGILSHSVDEIVRILQQIKARHSLVTIFLPGMKFQSLVRDVDPRGVRFIIGRSPNTAANAALLARPRCSFHSELPEWHVEFAAGGARETMHDGAASFEFGFPDVIVCHRPRAHPRVPVEPQLPLQCVADGGGVASFEASIADVSEGGLGFLVYASAITLEPGTLLRGCRIRAPNGNVVVVDLEVRYSQQVTFPDGKRATRSGCRLVNPGPDALEFIRHYVGPKS
jgi:hypothetical protein